jgi:hypothetical protein
MKAATTAIALSSTFDKPSIFLATRRLSMRPDLIVQFASDVRPEYP